MVVINKHETNWLPSFRPSLISQLNARSDTLVIQFVCIFSTTWCRGIKIASSIPPRVGLFSSISCAFSHTHTRSTQQDMVTHAVLDDHLELLEYMELMLIVQCAVYSIAPLYQLLSYSLQYFYLHGFFTLTDERRYALSVAYRGHEIQLFRFVE
jgi:hypothetical protein